MRRTGDEFEERARRYLEKAGLRTLERNFHTRFGELDLIMRDAGMLVFVEVRYRSSRHFGGAAASVTASKRRKLVQAASGFLGAHPKLAQRPCRFDVVTFEGPRDAALCHWERAAFDAD